MSDRSGFSAFSNQSLAGFVPALVIDYLLEKLRRKEPRKLPEKQTFDSVVMFADISGFTNLAEKLSLKGPEGTELLAFTLNRYMELLVNGISRSGGDIFKFAGDAMIIVWPPPVDNNFEELTIMCRQAIQSALDIQSKLTDFKIIDEVKLSVKIGFGIGQVTIAHVGGVFQRAEYLPAGSPLTQAFECEHLAPHGGVVIVSKQTWERTCNFFDFEQIQDLHAYKGENAPFFYVKKVKKSVKMKADAFLIKNKLKPGDLETIRGSLKSYIPAAVVPFIELDQEKWSAELRRLSVLFVNLGIDLKDTQTQSGLERIQQVIECVQKCVYSNQGSLNKFLMDDKGSTLMVVFGLYPMAHQDDPVRAVLTAMSLVSDLKPIKCSCSVGVTTGMVFAGVVGTSGNRREYSVLGDSVNLSARFMQAACQEKEKKVLVDEVTKLEAEHKLRFRFVKKSTVKGKTGEISFFEPVEEEVGGDSRMASETKISRISLENKVKIHVVDGWDNRKMIGGSYEAESGKGMILLEKFLNKPAKNGMVLIFGSYGAGKSLMVTDIVEKMAARLEGDVWKYGEKMQIYANSLNNVEKGRKMNGWRRILQEILMRVSLRNKQNCESMMYRLLEKNEELADSLYLVSDILGIRFKNSTGSNRSKYIQRAQDIYERKLIKKILIRILLKYLEEEDETNNDVSIEENMQKSSILMPSILSSELMLKKKSDNANTPAPLIIVLDDMQDYDHLSWDFSFKVMRKLKKVFIFACVRNKFIELPPVFKKQEPSKGGNDTNTSHGSHRKTLTIIKPGFGDLNNQEELVEAGMYEFEEICENSYFVKLDLKGLEAKECEQLLLKSLGVKKFEFEAGALNNSASLEKFFGFVVAKTEGMPLDLLHFAEKLRDSVYGRVNDERKVFELKKDILKMIEIGECLTLDAPLCRVKVNGPMIDRLSASHLLLMKAAAVIGDTFDLQTLIKVNPYKTLGNDKLRSIVNELERQDFIEILDEQNNNIYYRFTSPFMREVIYQRLLYSQRRNLHRYVAEAIQAIPLLSMNPTEEKLECDRLIYHWCMAENKNPFLQKGLVDPGVDFSNKAKRSIIVKKISSLLSKNPSNFNVVIKKGELDKKSDRGYKWSKRYCLMNTREFKYYYNEADSNRDSSIDQPLGTIPFKNIFQIMPIKETESKGKAYAFVIYVGSWQKKDKDMGIREFYFSAYSDDELEQWTTYMEFIRAKAIYDSFVNTFGKISFPLTNNALEKLETVDDALKLGQSLTKMTFMAPKEIGHQSFLNSYKSPNSSIRKTTFKPMNTKLKKDTMAFNELRETTSTEIAMSNYNAECHKKLKERLSRFFESAHFLFWSHVFEVCGRARSKTEKPEAFMQVFGHNTAFMKEKNHHFFFERVLFDDVLPPQSILDKRISKYHTSFSINGRSSNASVLYNSIDSMDELNNTNNSSPAEKLSPGKHLQQGSALQPVKQLTNIDENVASEDLISPHVKIKKSFSLRPEEKAVSGQGVKSEGDIYNTGKKKSQFMEDSKIESLEKIEEVNETRDSLIITDKSLELLKSNRESSKNGSNKDGKRKSRFLKMVPVALSNHNIETPERMSENSRKSEKEGRKWEKDRESDKNIEDLRNLPVLSVKIGQNSHKYIEEKSNFGPAKDYEEVVVKTKKGDVQGRNENYGAIWKRITKNELPLKVEKNNENEEITPVTSNSNIEEKNNNSIKEILRASIQKARQEEQHEEVVKKSGFVTPIAEKKQEYKEETSIEKLEKWEKENKVSPSEERKVEVFTEMDYKYLNFPHNLNYFKEESPPKLVKSEEAVVKRKKKDYSEYQSRKKEINDEDKVFFKDYESLVKTQIWESGNKSNKSSGKQENLNYKSVTNFKSKH